MQIWIPDTRSREFAREARRQSLAVARSPGEREDQAFLDAILQSPCHIITTVRRKQDYEMTKDNSGKVKIEKGGLRVTLINAVIKTTSRARELMTS